MQNIFDCPKAIIFVTHCKQGITEAVTNDQFTNLIPCGILSFLFYASAFLLLLYTQYLFAFQYLLLFNRKQVFTVDSLQQILPLIIDVTNKCPINCYSTNLLFYFVISTFVTANCVNTCSSSMNTTHLNCRSVCNRLRVLPISN